MSDKRDRSLDQSKKPNENFVGELYRNMRLILRLLKDRRIHFLLKFLPVGALIYLVVPLDFFPINPLDDALVIWLGSSLFIALCPDDIVQEHRNALQQSSIQDPSIENTPSDIVDAEFKDVSSQD